MDIPKAYNPQATEDKILSLWEKSDFASPDTCVKKGIAKKNAKPFSIVLPPPNVTGTLHMGHAAMLAIEDILIRYHRMRGDKTLWLPGTDHAAIATESKVEQMLYKAEGKTRHDLGHTEFLKRVEQFAKESHDTILHQVKKMGASLDWSREAYTLDEKRNLAVRTAFKKMYEGGLIYRGDRIVNWDPKMQTTVSDDEIEWKEETTPFYYLQYGPFLISTARPETKFGDKYVVMHPKDKRYKEYTHGQKIELEWISGPVTATIIKDEAIDMEFGTGVMTITPWHDTIDFEIAERHHLEKEQIIDLKGNLLPIAKEFTGLYITKARSLIIQKLQEKGLVKKIDENYVHRIATNSRGGGVIEPQIMRQWFVNVSKPFAFPHAGLKSVKKGELISLKDLVARVVKKKEIEILPKRFEKTYFHWINNLRDWCISRQIWFGHQIPVWYKSAESYVGVKAPKEEGWTQDTDTLDTWFSSGLWTFSTLGWPKKTKDLETFHPTSVLETGYDILFFWVARMVLMTAYLMGEVPFKTVYLHGLVRDDKGRKMSKSLGNIIDPLDMIAKYGADATRLSLIIGAAPGNDMKISEDKVRGYRNFVNKIWNISRFLAMNTQDFTPKKKPTVSSGDKKLLNDCSKLTTEITKHIESFHLSRAAESLYHYTWHTFADKIIEQSKAMLSKPKTRASRQYALLCIFSELLKLLHPFIPFVTEELYQHLSSKNKKESIMIEKWPA
ncbi:MAG: valine--tRNA ligase [Candidatus Wildermuthbacteria bacterium RIFCSPHIGHO2_02_FULL_47_12]|uniref:Valine--tRNA ligase n=1 Tax=Candidatus Wildermuthbacteria bacterium RIFCSPHIGHO2_02_FULL_47_12 TaxID=1802451 RepID=A0A1G2R529_9BACT|nr:MAG: valine--tRNA ligase [Candidatus Wildermuthbacteria bacterium RIFCSPHIGHO2_02_FULL_47_12]